MTADIQLSTKERIVQAALQTIKEEGFAGTSARAIARRGEFNQALIFYHFGTLNDLLLTALDRTSEMRMTQYRERIAGIENIEGAVRVASDLYREDLASGHITVLSEMIAGSLDRPDLGPEIVERMQPWIELTSEVVSRVFDAHGGTGIVDPDTVAFAIVALYLGIDMLSHLEKDDRRAESFFETASKLATALAQLGGAS